MQETRVQSLGWKIPWSRKWQHTPVILPRKSYGQRRLVGYSLRGCKELDTTVWLSTHTHTHTHTHAPLVACSSDAQWWCPEHWADNTDHWSLGKHSRILEASGYNIFINRSIVTCLETPYSIPIADSSTLNSQPTALWLLLKCSLSDECIFPTRHIPGSFLFHFKKLNSDMYQYKY